MKMKEYDKKDWIVTMVCRIRKSVTLENCTREEVENNPWDYACDEYEIEQMDWEVEDVKENK